MRRGFYWKPLSPEQLKAMEGAIRRFTIAEGDFFRMMALALLGATP